MVACRQSRDERCDLSRLRVDDHDAGAVVLSLCVCRLVRVGGEKSPSLKATLERDVDRRPCWLESDAGRGGLAERTADQLSVLIEYQDVRRERILRIEVTRSEASLLVAGARQSVTGLQHINLELLRIAEKSNPGWHVETRGEDRDLVPRRQDDVLTLARIEKGRIV